MSGEAGWTIRAERYSLFIGSGISVCVAISPGGDGSEIGEYFDRASEPFRRWAERARPVVDEVFARTALPVVPEGEPFEEIDGIVIEDPDEKARHFRQYSRGKPCPIHLRGGPLPRGQSLKVRFLVSERVRRVDLDGFRDEVVAAVLAVEAEPAPPVGPPPPPPREPSPSRPGLLARLFRRAR